MSEENKKEDKEEITEEKQVKLNNKNFNFNFTLIIVALILAFAYIYVENGKIAYQEKLKAEEEIEQRHLKIAYESCLTEAYSDYIATWNRTCKKRKLKDDCSLPAYNADSIEKMYESSKKQCMDKLKNKAF